LWGVARAVVGSLYTDTVKIRKKLKETGRDMRVVQVELSPPSTIQMKTHDRRTQGRVPDSDSGRRGEHVPRARPRAPSAAESAVGGGGCVVPPFATSKAHSKGFAAAWELGPLGAGEGGV
jgi:hypothetical protein